jgi:hypothetical protein
VNRINGVGPVLMTTLTSAADTVRGGAALTVVLGALRNDDEITGSNVLFLTGNDSLGGTGSEDEVLVDVVDLRKFGSVLDEAWNPPPRRCLRRLESS